MTVAERHAAAKALVEEVEAEAAAEAAADSERPPQLGCDRHLLGVELAARNMTAFNRGTPSLMENTGLREYENSGKQAWPPRQTFDPSMFEQR